MSTATPTLESIANGTCIVRNTAGTAGPHWSLTPGPTASRHLHYGRVILGGGDAPFDCQHGRPRNRLHRPRGQCRSSRSAGATYAMTPYDALYVPRDSRVRVAAGRRRLRPGRGGGARERSIRCSSVRSPTCKTDSGLHFAAGGPSSKRELNVLMGKNVEAGRIMAGVTFSEPGNWTSWPPHEHAVLAEEAYLYIDMPAPAFGVQLVYTNPREPELATIVREGDVVLMPQGYHPNVAAPGGAINFLWMMAATREDVDRQFGVVNVQPEFATGGSGLDPGTIGQEMSNPASVLRPTRDLAGVPTERVGEASSGRWSGAIA